MTPSAHLEGRLRRPVVAMLIAFAALAPVRAADREEALPKPLEGVGIDQLPGARLPLDARFIDENGEGIALGDLFKSGRPVILDLGYYGCPMLCGLVLNAMLDGIKPLTLTPGKDFEIVVVSIDPNETPQLAKAKKANYLESYGRPETAAGWHFLTGGNESITRLATAIGFRYRYVPEDRQFAHAAGLFIVTPDGTLSRTLTGIEFRPRTLRLALSEASAGKLGGVVDQILLFCFHYDASTGRYALAATRLMQAGGAVTALVVGLTLFTLWSRERRRRAPSSPEAKV